MRAFSRAPVRPVVVRLQRDVDAGLLGGPGHALDAFRHARHVGLLVELLGEHAAEQPQRRTADVLRGLQEALGEPDAFLELGGIVHREAAVPHDGGDLDAVRVEELADARALRGRFFGADVLAGDAAQLDAVESHRLRVCGNLLERPLGASERGKREFHAVSSKESLPGAAVASQKPVKRAASYAGRNHLSRNGTEFLRGAADYRQWFTLR